MIRNRGEITLRRRRLVTREVGRHDGKRKGWTRGRKRGSDCHPGSVTARSDGRKERMRSEEEDTKPGRTKSLVGEESQKKKVSLGR